MSNVEQLLKDSIVLDALSAPKEYKEARFDLPPLPEEKVAAIIDDEEEGIIDSEIIAAEEKKESGSTEMTADAIIALIHGLSFFGQNHLSKKFARKLSAEEWFKLDEIKKKVSEETSDEEKELLIRASFNEKELDRLQKQVELTDRESEILEKATKFWTADNNIKAGSNTTFLTTIVSVLGPKVYSILEA